MKPANAFLVTTRLAIISLALIARALMAWALIAWAPTAWADNTTQSQDAAQSKDAAPQTSSKFTPYNLTPEQKLTLQQGTPVLDVWAGRDDSRIVEVFGAVDIAASPQHIWTIMQDCDLQKQIIANMTRCVIENADPNGRWDERLQVLNIGFFLPRVKSKFRSDYIPYRQINISRTGGDLAVLDGMWSLAITDTGQTRVSYRARLKPRLPVPRKLMRKATRKDMPLVLNNLQNLAQRHQAEQDNQRKDNAPQADTSQKDTLQKDTAQKDNGP